MKTQITLEAKEVKQIISKALRIPEKQVVQLRYGFAIEGMTSEEVEERLKMIINQ